MIKRAGSRRRHWCDARTGLLCLLLLSCSSVPRFTRPDVAPVPRPATRPALETPSAPDTPRAASAGEWHAGQIWRTTVSWYDAGPQAQLTASGEAYDPSRVSAAHRELPFGTWLQVKNLDNGRKLEVRVNDRGPFKEGRDLDLSREAARRLGYLERGTAQVEVRVLTLP